jgi:hypothetical protein
MNAAAGNHGSHRNPSDLERDSDTIRADMDRTLEALENKFSPREIVDRSLDYVREHGAEIVERIGETVRSNPVPVVMTAAGLAWLATSIVRHRNDFADDELSRDESRFYDADDFAQEEFEEETEAEESQYAENDDWESAAYGETGTYSEADTGGNGAGGARVVGRRLTRSAKRSANVVRKQVGQAGQSAARSIAEQPLFWGMLALATGALIGSALPATDYERQLLAHSPKPVTRARNAVSGGTSGNAGRQQDENIGGEERPV